MTIRRSTTAMLATALMTATAAGCVVAPAMAQPSTAAAQVQPVAVQTGDVTPAPAQDLPTEPDSSHDTDNRQWYDHTPLLRGTAGAPIEGQTEAVVTYDDDGVTGMIKNFSKHDVLVRTSLLNRTDARAILKTGDEMPYKFYAAGEVELTRMKDGQTVTGTTAKLWIKDPFVGRPSTKFTPPGHSHPANVREGLREGASNHELWGSTALWVKRETDGWTIPASDKYLDRYLNPNTPGTTDWAIFTIHVDNL